MKKNKSVLFILIALMALVIACKRDHSNYGQQDCTGSNVSYETGHEFSLNKTSPATIDFTSTDTLRVRAALTQSSPWTITIRGLKSHAVKTITGFSAIIDTTWYGRPTGNVLFITEQVSVTLDIRCREDLSRTGNVNIRMGNYSNDPNLVIVSNFDDIIVPIGLDFTNDSTFGKGIYDTAYCPSTHKTGYCLESTSPQGGNALVFKGTTAITGGGDKNTYGNYEIYPPVSFFSKIPVGTQPADLWLNFYAHSSGTPIKVTVAFIVTNPGIGNSKKLGKVSFSIDSTAWKMFSINLAQLTKGPGDLPTFDVSQLEYFTITVGQVNAISPSYFNMDMISFSRRESFLGGQLVQ